MADVFAAVTFMLPVMQDAKRQPEKWNSDWESLTRTLDRAQGPSDLVHSKVLQLTMEPQRMDMSFLEHQTLLSRLCHLQRWLTADVHSYFVGEDLEARWMKATPEMRRKHILIGLTDACSIARNLHDARIYCGVELRLSYLQKDGRTVLGLLKTVMIPVEDLVKMPEKPLYVPHAGWDALAEDFERSAHGDTEKLAIASILVLRTKLICHVLHSIVRSFLGEALPVITVAKFRKKNAPGEPFMGGDFGTSIVENLLGPAGAKALEKDNKAAWKERQSNRKEHCSYFGCHKANEGNAKFPRCKKCWEKMQREVLYCSVECQTADWKDHHKPICGKPLTFDTVSKPRLTPLRTTPQIGAAVGGYQRSPALMFQITALNLMPKMDYIIMIPGDETNLDFPDPEAQSLFRKCREKAVTTGDRQSIAIMAHFLCWMTMEDLNFKSKGLTSNMLANQLKREYMFDELHLAVHEMQRKQNMDPFRRPPLLTSMSPQNWKKFCAGMNVVKQVVLES